MKPARTEGALLAGVCAGIARTFSWNVWALRALFVVFLLIKTLWAIAVYAALAVALYLADQARAGRSKSRSSLRSPELADRSRRIEELEKRFEDLERRG